MKTTSDDTLRFQSVRDSLAKFFEGTLNREMIFIKLSTNGLIVKNPPLPSVLGIAAAKYKLRPRREIVFLNQYERYYLPKESFNAKAILVNGLDEPTLFSKRNGHNYPEHFDEDKVSLRKYCKNTQLYAGHNIDGFEVKLLPWLHDPENKTFDIMKENVNILRLEHDDYGFYEDWKWPTFQELLDFYSIPVPDDCTHSGMASVKLIASTFQEMLRRSELRRIVVSC
jgi:DNA polymerase III epsilon subunit-like protein